MTEEEFKSITDNEAFIGLIHQCLHDKVFCRRILYVLRSDDLTRADIIASWVNGSSHQQAPAEFVEALGFLAHREIANEALRQLIPV